MPPLSTTTTQEPRVVHHAKEDFIWSLQPEPHKSRRTAILAKHPEIADLYGYDPSTKWTVISFVAIQFGMTFAVQDAPWWLLLCLTYAISGTLNHSLSLAVHELSHNLMFQKQWMNAVLGFVANLPQAVPSFATFRRYHMEHHYYQGVDGIDTDIPTKLEGHFFTTPLRKTLFLILQPLFYAIRPMVVCPKPLTRLELFNLAVLLSFDGSILYFLGFKSFFYMLFGTLLGMGLHPVAGHFIAEHYVFTNDQETYSYYGPLNAICFNVGYHNEHHDFPRIPGSRLPLVRKIAKEFYDPLPHYDSWTKVLFDFITNDEIGCFSRVKRSKKTAVNASID